MNAYQAMLAAVVLASSLRAAGATYQVPTYSAAGVVNAASYSASALAPNTIASIFGTNLSFKTGAVSSHDLTNDGLPTSFGGVTVYVGGIAAGLYYVSPLQINFLIPNILLPGNVNIEVARDGLSGPAITIALGDTAPAMFQDANNDVIATDVDGTLISTASPASPQEWIVIYGAGLGRTTPEALTYGLATSAAVIRDLNTFDVLLNGIPVDRSAIYYAGLAPGFAGLYQVNVQLPGNVSANPEIRLSIGSQISIPKIFLPLQP